MDRQTVVSLLAGLLVVLAMFWVARQPDPRQLRSDMLIAVQPAAPVQALPDSMPASARERN